LKATAALLGCPIQMIRETSALQFRYKCSMYWRLSIALLTKAGGVPFRMMRPTESDTAYLGLAYAIRGGTANEFVTCCSQVFDAEGGGFEFIAYNVGADRDLENPHLTRDEMRTRHGAQRSPLPAAQGRVSAPAACDPQDDNLA
jgi:hypothetical protein